MTSYAIVSPDGSTIINVAVCDDATWATNRGWIAIDNSPGGPGIGWITGDGGETWSPDTT